MNRILPLCLLIAPAAWAETPLSASEFEALVEGKTLSFATGTDPYGVEYYAPNRQVVWSFQGNECIRGEWYEVATDAGPNICFVYENTDEPQCWQVFDIDGKIRVDFMNVPGTTVLFETVESEPLVCGGVGS